MWVVPTRAHNKITRVTICNRQFTIHLGAFKESQCLWHNFILMRNKLLCKLKSQCYVHNGLNPRPFPRSHGNSKFKPFKAIIVLGWMLFYYLNFWYTLPLWPTQLLWDSNGNRIFSANYMRSHMLGRDRCMSAHQCSWKVFTFERTQ